MREMSSAWTGELLLMSYKNAPLLLDSSSLIKSLIKIRYNFADNALPWRTPRFSLNHFESFPPDRIALDKSVYMLSNSSHNFPVAPYSKSLIRNPSGGTVSNALVLSNKTTITVPFFFI